MLEHSPPWTSWCSCMFQALEIQCNRDSPTIRRGMLSVCPRAVPPPSEQCSTEMVLPFHLPWRQSLIVQVRDLPLFSQHRICLHFGGMIGFPPAYARRLCLSPEGRTGTGAIAFCSYGSSKFLTGSSRLLCARTAGPHSRRGHVLHPSQSGP